MKSLSPRLNTTYRFSGRIVNYVACLAFFFLGMSVFPLAAQTTSWKGTVSTSWSTDTNWTNGVPNSTKDVIIGDDNFTGSYQPDLKFAII